MTGSLILSLIKQHKSFLRMDQDAIEWIDKFWEDSLEHFALEKDKQMLDAAVSSSPFFVSLLNLFGQMAPWAAVIVCLAPLPTVRQITKEKSVGSVPLLPYTSLILSAFFWTAYGLLKGEPKIWSANSVGFFLGIYYFWAYCQYVPSAKLPYATLPGSVMKHVQVMCALMGTTMLMIMSGWEGRVHALGKISVCFSIAFFYSPLSTMRTVIQSRSASSIPLPLTVATVINCLLWFTYGWFEMRDVNIYFPNGLGLCFGMAQVALKVIYGNGPSRRQQQDSEPNDLTMELMSA